MKRFAFEFEGMTRHLGQLDQDKKDDILDFMVAGRLRQADRMHKKGYRSDLEHEADKKAAYIKWGSSDFLNELFDEGNAKKFLRALIIEPVDDDTLLRLVQSQKDEDSELRRALARMAEDADPKAQTRPPSEPTPTAGAASS